MNSERLAELRETSEALMRRVGVNEQRNERARIEINARLEVITTLQAQVAQCKAEINQIHAEDDELSDAQEALLARNCDGCEE